MLTERFMEADWDRRGSRRTKKSLRSNLVRSGAWPAMTFILCGVSLLGFGRAASLEAQEVDFNDDIRPLLSDRCFKCHGPDEQARKGKVRLDTREGAYRTLSEGRFVIKPGQPDLSEMVRRIDSPDLDERMPPPESNLSLNERERDLIRRWIEQGAEFESHWAFLPVKKPGIPAVKPAGAANHPIDAFVLARLEGKDLIPAPPARQETLIRRLTLDLTGLPPTPEEIRDFLADSSPGAYERVVERLLQSPAYGERMANDWLDLARYADTYGYQADVDRDMSPWRDWVLRAFNENLPYDQFILWQLAGDLLPDATRDQVLATAFNRLHRQTNEGGSIEEEFRVEYAADRVHTMGTAFLGLTLECARCHDHKYDPITQKNYYEMFAFFNNIDESGLYSHFTRAVPAPALLLYGEGGETTHQALRREIADAERYLDSVRREARPRFERWRKEAGKEPRVAAPMAAFAFDEVEDNKSPNGIRADQPLELHEGPAQVDGRFDKALRFSGDNSAAAPGVGPFGRADPFSFSLWIKVTAPQSRSVVFHRSRAWTDSGSRGYELLLEDHRPSFNLVHFWPGNALGVRAKAALPTNEWVHLVVTYDGSSRADGVALYRDGRLQSVEVTRDHLYKDIHHRKEWGDADVGNVHFTLAGRFRDSGFKDGLIDELKIFDTKLTPLEIALLAGADVEVPDGGSWFEWYLHRVDESFQKARRELEECRDRENAWVNDIPEIMVMREMPQRRATHVLKRGSYASPGETVRPATPDSIMPFPDDFPRNRLGLARWMVNRGNPLTARVAVNRIWKIHFGRGLVETVEDFGSQGSLPSHPGLLDWLAAWFMETGWDRKRLHKMIVTSATYRQTSLATPGQKSNDPDNRWLARGPQHRLSAEMIRDSALALSGLLSRKVGGPSVYPYQPPGVWEESGTGKTYHPSTGEGLYRRSLYTFWRRTAPPPSMLTFDATSREVCTARREVTSTPLQALVLLNDPQFLEASRALAERLMRKHGDRWEAALDEAWLALTGRSPDATEGGVVRRLYREQLEYFQESPDAAEQFLRIGEHPTAESISQAELAALTVVANALMNFDEFVVKR